MLMHARDEADREGMSDRQLRDEVITILLAGHATTAVTSRGLFTSWRATLPSRSACARSWRRRSPVVRRASTISNGSAWIVGRHVSRDVTLDGHRLPGGGDVIFSPWVLHRPPSLWMEPDAFRPERFAEGAGPPHKHAYLPFLAGPRQCIGNAFAMMEAQLVLATLVLRFHFEAASNHPVDPEPLLTLRPRNGIWLRVDSRIQAPTTRS